MRSVPTFILLALLTSCGFNKQFYKPDKLPANMGTVTIYNKDKADTMLIHFEGADRTAVFTDTKNNPKLLDYTIKTISFTSADGHKLYGWFIKPTSFPEPKVTLLFLHGNAGNVLSQLGFVIPLVKKGFQVLLVDYSGYGFSTGKPTRKNMLADANSALRLLHSMDETKNTRLLLYGQSMGGYLTHTVAAENEGILDGIVSEGAPSSLKDVAASRYKAIGFLARLLVKDKNPAFESVREFHKPVLIIHSTEDEAVPFAEGQKIYRNANAPKSFYEIRHEHIYGTLYYADSIAHKIRTMVR